MTDVSSSTILESLAAVAEDGLLVTRDKDYKFTFSQVVALMAEFALEQLSTEKRDIEGLSLTITQKFNEFLLLAGGSPLEEEFETLRGVVASILRGESAPGPAEPLQDLPATPDDPRPRIICLCGSTRFADVWMSEYQRLSDDGNIVLTVAKMPPRPNLQKDQPELKARLDKLHLHKIKLADEIFVLNVGGYIGGSTRNEISYAAALGKVIRYLETVPTPRGLDDEVGYFTEETHHGITFQNPPLSPEEVEQAKRLKAERDHPEAFCKECGRPNVTWFVNSNLWNQVMRRNGQPEPIICMVCFVKRAESQGIIPISWQLCPENYDALQQEAPVCTAAPAQSEGQNTESASSSGPQQPAPEREKDSRDARLTEKAREFITLPLAQWRDIDGEKFGKEEDRRSLAEFIADMLVAFACELSPDPHRELLADAQLRDMEIMHCGHPYKYVTHGIPGAEGCLLCELTTTREQLAAAKKDAHDWEMYANTWLDGGFPSTP